MQCRRGHVAWDLILQNTIILQLNLGLFFQKFIHVQYLSINGRVRVVVSDGNGGWYIGGDFTKIDGFERNRLAHINALSKLQS